MTAPKLEGSDLHEVQRGLRMARPPDPVALAEEKAELAQLEQGPAGPRIRFYLKQIGPGYLQSAMTLGGGTAATSLFAGAMFGYQLMWVAPVAMLLGIIVLAAVSHQTLSTGLRPLPAMATYAGRPLAWGWAAGALLSSVIWHLPQYNLAANSLVDIGVVAGALEEDTAGTGARMAMSLLVLAWAVALSLLYSGSARLVRVYERLLKYMVWGIVLCFAWVVANTETDWGGVLAGFVPFQFPASQSGVSSLELAVSGLAAAVGVNMVFLYPYSLLARGWGREHRGLARFDLLAGMLVPYALATSLMVIATANTLHAGGVEVSKAVAIPEAGRVLGDTIGPVAGRLIFDLGVLAMGLSSITLHMLVCGFVAMEWFGFAFGSRGHRLATLIPVPGVLAPLFWGDYAVYLAIPTTILCGSLLPLTYLGFLLLQRSKAYLGPDRPTGLLGALWSLGIAAAMLVLVAFLVQYALELIDSDAL